MIEDKAKDVHWTINYIKTNWIIMMQIPEILIGLPVLSWLAARYYYKGLIDSKAHLLEDREKEVKLLEKKKTDLETNLESGNGKIKKLESQLKRKEEASSGNQESTLVVEKEPLPITIKIEHKLISISLPEKQTEQWDVFSIVLCNISTKPINNVTVEFVDFYHEVTKSIPRGFSKNIPFPLISNVVVSTKTPKTIPLVSLKKRSSPYVSPDIYIGGVGSGKPDAELRNPAIMLVNITRPDYPDEILSATIRIQFIRNQNSFDPNVEILETGLK